MQFRGAKVILHGSDDFDSVKDEIHHAWMDLQNVKRIHGTGGFWSTLCGGGRWKVVHSFGLDTIVIYGKPGEKVGEKEKVVREVAPAIRYLPAFHTCDEDGNWLGITICLSGVWGPPYYFVSCEQSDIFDFDWGQWNDYTGNGTPPDYDVYKKRVLRIEPSTIDPVGQITYSEVPADHLYVGAHQFWDQNSSLDYYFTGSAFEYRFNWNIPYSAHSAIHRSAYWDSLVSTNYPLVIYTGVPWSQLPLSNTLSWVTDFIGPYECTYGGFSCDSPSGVPPCPGASYTTWLATATAYANGLTTPLSYSHSDVFNYHLVQTETGYSPDMNEEHSTFVGETWDQGAYLFPSLRVDKITYKDKDGYYTEATFPNIQGSPVNVVEDNRYCAEYVCAFGTMYTLAEYPGVTSTYLIPNKFQYVRPRVYNVTGKTTEGVMLASVTRYNYDTTEYMLVNTTTGDVQIGDESVKFPCTYHSRHSLNYSSGGTELFAYGEFSLVEVFDHAASSNIQRMAA